MKNEPKTAKTEVKMTAAATAPKAAKIEEPVQKAAEVKNAKAAVKETVKKAETKVVEKAETVKEEVKKEVKDAAKKTTAAAKKTTAAAKKTGEAAAKKAAAPKTTETVYFQFYGNEVNKDDLVARIKDIWTKELNRKAADFKDVKVYVKFEECAAYYVVNGEVEGRISL